MNKDFIMPIAYVLFVPDCEDLADKGEEIPNMSNERFMELATDEDRGRILTLQELQSAWNNEEISTADSYIRLI